MVVLPVFFTFARQLCLAIRDDQYSVGQIDSDLREFRWALSRELCPDPHTHSAWWQSFDYTVREAIEHSADWREHLRERAEVAEGRSTIIGSADSRAVIERRKRLLTTYKAATGVRFDAAVYEAVKVHRSDFIKWKKGELPAESTMTMRIEEFLRAMKRPAS